MINEKLVDIEAIEFDSSMSKEERKRHFLEQIKNPHCFLCKGVVVHTAFSENGRTFEECISDFLKAKML